MSNKKNQQQGHTMKGEGGGFGFDPVSAMGARLELADYLVQVEIREIKE